MLTKTDVKTLDFLITKRLDEGLSPIKGELKHLTGDIKSLKKDMVKIKKDLKTTIDFFDKDIVDLKKRTKRIETHLSLSSPVAI